MIASAIAKLLRRGRETFTLKNHKDWLLRAAGGGVHTIAGTDISETNQLEISVNLACIGLIAETMASLRPNLYRERRGGGKDIAYAEPLQEILHTKPNSEMTGFTHRQVSTTHLALFGNRYDQILKDRYGNVRELWPLVPERVTKYRNRQNREIKYDVTNAGRVTTLDADEILHVPGFSKDGLQGQSLASLQRLRLGISKALDEYEAHFFGQGFHPSMIGEYGGVSGAQFIQNPKQQERVEKMKEEYAGLAKSHGIMIAEGGIKIKPIENRLDWSMLDQRQQAAALYICGLWRVPPSLIGILYWATFSNITHLDLQFGKYCIRVWATREEDSLNCGLLSDAQRRAGYSIAYPLDDIYRTDIETRNKALKEMWDRGILNSDEWREMEGRNPKEGTTGKTYYVPANFLPEGTQTEKPKTERSGGGNVVKLK